METASELKRPAAEAVATRLEKEPGPTLRFPESELFRAKQMVGTMIKQILWDRGYTLDQGNVVIRVGDLFKRASRYRRKVPVLPPKGP